MESESTIGFDALPDKAYTWKNGYFEYSEIPLVDTLAWLTKAPDIIRAMTIVNMAPLLRDDRLTQRWGALVDIRLSQFLEAEVVHEEDGIENQSIPFVDQLNEDGLDVAKLL